MSARDPRPPAARPRSTATVRFYVGFGIALALVILAAYGVGYRVGEGRAAGAARHAAP